MQVECSLNTAVPGAPRPSLDLGPYVVARPRKDGTFRVCQEVPKRLRSAGWPASLHLPLSGTRTGKLDDPDECSRIKQDAEKLHAELLKQKNGECTAIPRPRTWETLVELWQSTTDYRAKSEATKKNRAIHAKRLLKFFDKHPDLQPSLVTESDIEALLSNWEHSRDMKEDMRLLAKMLMTKAIKEKWRTDNPVADIPNCRPTAEDRHVIIWEIEDVERMCAACIAAGQPGIAALIRTLWDIGQRLADARRFQHGVQYRDGVFQFEQQKTGTALEIPAPAELRPYIEQNVQEGGFLIVNQKTGLPFTEQQLSNEFTRIRDAIPEYQNRRIVLRNLRHSCVVQLGRAGCSVPEIAAITGHILTTVDNILKHYLPRDNTMVLNAMEKRRRMNLGQLPIQQPASKVTDFMQFTPLPAYLEAELSPPNIGAGTNYSVGVRTE